MAGNNSVTGDQTVTHTDNLSFDGTDRDGAMSLDGELWIGSATANRPGNKGHVRKNRPTINANGNLAFGPGTITINPYNTAKWIVDPIANIGTHTTIADALTAASSGETIFIRPGTYTENLTLKVGVTITAHGGDSITPTVTILGNATATFTGACTIANIALQTNSAAFLTVSGSNNTVVNLHHCALNCTNNTGITYSTSGASSGINLYQCTGNLSTTGIAFFAHSSAGRLSIRYCLFSNTGLSTTANTCSAGILDITNSTFNNPITTSGTATYNSEFNLMSPNGAGLNSTALTAGGSGVHASHLDTYGSGTASAISVGASCTLIIDQASISSTNTNAVTGAGTLNYGNLSFAASSSVMNTTTQTALYSNLGKYKASGQPCFMATQNSSGTNNTGDGTVYTLGTTVDLTERFDQDSNFDPTTGVFTAPVTGRYHLSMCALITGATTMTAYESNIITTNKTYASKMQNSALAVQQFGYPLSVICDMTAGDTATAAVFTTDGGGKIDDVFGDATKAYTYFCGFLVA